MKKITLNILVLLIYCSHVKAQMCPGGGTNFSNAVTFDPAWIYGCNTGTSCNGGSHFSNLPACEPTASLDPCAPPPSCVTLANTSSDIWFKFYAANTTVTIKGFQNTSFVIGLQAFSGGPTCGSLTDIGCAVAAGPSSGVSLTLTGLTVGQLYYYRVFGSAGPISQRSGLYCFCGTIGLQNYVLPSVLQSFTAANKNDYNQINWKINPGNNIASVEIQKSLDGKNFFGLAVIPANEGTQQYSYSDKSNNVTSYYRIRLTNHNGEMIVSPLLTIKSSLSAQVSLLSNLPGKPVELQITQPVILNIYSANGTFIKTFRFQPGKNILDTKLLSNGIYLIQNAGNNSGIKFIVLNN